MTMETTTAAETGLIGKTPLGMVRGLGSAREGGGHWGHERAVSVALLLLTIWFFVSLWRLPAFDQGTFTEWLRQPLAAVPMLLLVFTFFEHLRMGLTVVVEDYVHDEGNKLLSLLLINLLAIGAGALAFFCVLKIALGGGAG